MTHSPWASDQAASAWCRKPSGTNPKQRTPVGNAPMVPTVCKGKGIRWRAVEDNN